MVLKTLLTALYQVINHMDYSNFYNLLGGTGTGFLGSTVLPFLNGLDGRSLLFGNQQQSDLTSTPVKGSPAATTTVPPPASAASQQTSQATATPRAPIPAPPTPAAPPAPPAQPPVQPPVQLTQKPPAQPPTSQQTQAASTPAPQPALGNSIEDQLVRRWANELVRHQRYDNGKMDYQLGPKTISDLRYRAQRAMLDPTFASMAKADIGNPQLTREYAGQALRNVRHEAGLAKAMEPTVEEKARMQQSGMMRNPTAPAAINNPPTNQSRPAYSDAASRSTTTPGLMV